MSEFKLYHILYCLRHAVPRDTPRRLQQQRAVAAQRIIDAIFHRAHQSQQRCQRRCRRRRCISQHSLTAHAFPMAFPRSGWDFLLPSPSSSASVLCFGFAFAQSPFAVCMCESDCVQLMLNPHHTRWLRFLAFPPLRRFTFIHQKQFGGGFHWQLGNWKWKRNLLPTFPFSHLPSSFSCLRKMSRHF